MVLKDHRFKDVDEIKQCDGALYGEFLKVTLREVFPKVVGTLKTL